jgi:8-oxo-dGTP pyrophosphatase MutT (NUDIX family)
MRTIVPRGARQIPENAERVFKGIMYDVYHWPQKLYDGTIATFEMLRRQDSVKVLAIKDGKIIVLKEEQPGIPSNFALPGGRHDVESETELQCAQREVKEETGLIFKSWKLVDAAQLSIEIDWCTYLFVATDPAGQQDAHHDAGEKIEIHALTYDEVINIEANYPTLNHAISVLKKAGSINGLLALPEYK